MLARDRACRVATQHARDLGDARVTRDGGDAALGDGAVMRFVDDEVVVGVRRDLGEVRDDDDLSRLGQALQAGADLGRGLALANQLSDDSKRRAAVLDAWAPQLAAGLGLLD